MDDVPHLVLVLLLPVRDVTHHRRVDELGALFPGSRGSLRVARDADAPPDVAVAVAGCRLPALGVASEPTRNASAKTATKGFEAEREKDGPVVPKAAPDVGFVQVNLLVHAVHQ